MSSINWANKKSVATVLGAFTLTASFASFATDYTTTGAFKEWTIDDTFAGTALVSPLAKCLSPCVSNVAVDFDDGLGWRSVPTYGAVVSVYETVGVKTVRVSTNTTIGGSTTNVTSTNKLTVPNLSSPYPLDTWTVTADTPYAGAYATGEVYIYNSNWKRGAAIDKPIIVIDGFDPGNERKAKGLFESLNEQNLIDDLRAQGYDAIILNPDNGADWIQKNAFLLAKLINKVNSMTANREPLVIIGPSMGGLNARYALAWMEKNGMDHNTRLYVSFDSPNQGANIPLGVQHFLNTFSQVAGTPYQEVAANRAKIDSSAARQMLVYHYNQVQDNGFSLPEFNQFYTELAALGYPKKLRKIALSSGSASGLGQAGFGGGSDLVNWKYKDSGNCWDILLKSPKPYNIDMTIRAIGPGVGILGGNVKVCTAGVIYSYDGITSKTAASSVKPYDSAPGGYYDAPRQIDAGSTGGYGDIVATSPVAAFIPTVSALDIPTSNLFYNIQQDPDGLAKKSPFDAIYFPVALDTNERHTQITPEKKDILMREILGVGWLVPVISNLLLN